MGEARGRVTKCDQGSLPPPPPRPCPLPPLRLHCPPTRGWRRAPRARRQTSRRGRECVSAAAAAAPLWQTTARVWSLRPHYPRCASLAARPRGTGSARSPQAAGDGGGVHGRRLRQWQNIWISVCVCGGGLGGWRCVRQCAPRCRMACSESLDTVMARARDARREKGGNGVAVPYSADANSALVLARDRA